MFEHRIDNNKFEPFMSEEQILSKNSGNTSTSLYSGKKKSLKLWNYF